MYFVSKAPQTVGHGAAGLARPEDKKTKLIGSDALVTGRLHTACNCTAIEPSNSNDDLGRRSLSCFCFVLFCFFSYVDFSNFMTCRARARTAEDRIVCATARGRNRLRLGRAIVRRNCSPEFRRKLATDCFRPSAAHRTRPSASILCGAPNGGV